MDPHVSSPPSEGNHRSIGHMLSRTIKLVVGWILLLAGIAMIVLPGPALAFIPLGIAILATESPWFHRLLKHARDRAHRIRDHLRRDERLRHE